LIEVAWNDPMRFADLRNALDALSYAASEEAHAIVVRVLEHPDPTPRQAAWRALRPMARPSDFERVRALLAAEPSEFAPELAQLLFDTDPERAVAEYLDWIEDERRPELWNEVANTFPKTRDEVNALRACRLRAGALPILAIQLAGACAVAGDLAALEFLREELRGELAGARELALTALVESGHAEEVAWTLQNDPLPTLRARAAGVVAAEWPPERAEPLLASGVGDPDSSVSWTCLTALIERGQPEAVERALGRLGSDEPGVLERAVIALRPRMLADEPLAERAYAVLERRAQEEDWLDLGLRRGTLRAIGLTPCRAAALHLIEASRDVEGEVQGVPAERWILQQIGNAGDPGQVVLIEELARERDLHRRLDLIEALAAVPSARSDAWLLERAAAEDVDPWELLFVAERLTRVGPTARVAPVLKRSVLRVEQPDVRTALQALLWTWYPAPTR
ncbi:MAG TPA: HEAT repeat domain-containing protein, partial [Planctomycetota bacterium]|nr:HEAT repeat domain-containing protein [Planctomycetota bacterium]